MALIAGDHLFDFIGEKTALFMIQELPEKYRKVIYMRYAQDLSLREIAITTGQSKNTVAVQMHRDTEKIKLSYHLNKLRQEKIDH